MRSASRTWAARSLKAKLAASRCEPQNTKRTVTQGPCSQGAHNRIITNAPTGRAYLGEGALNYNDHAAHIAPALSCFSKRSLLAPIQLAMSIGVLRSITAPSGKADSTTSPDKTVSTINDITTQGSSTKATARVQPADARRIFTGKQHTVNPSGGKVSRL